MSDDYFKLAFDKCTDSIIHIDEVEQGYQNAICPNCKSTLISSNKKPRIKGTYFRHKDGSRCSGESIEHELAKQVILTKKKVLFPSEKEPVLLVNVQDEKRLDEGCIFIADIFCNVAETTDPLVIEVYRTSAVKIEKAQFFEKQNLQCLEIDISNVGEEQLSSSGIFIDYIINLAPRRWVLSQNVEVGSFIDESVIEDVAFTSSQKKELTNDVNVLPAVDKGIDERTRKKYDTYNKMQQLESEWRKRNSIFLNKIQQFKSYRFKKKLDNDNELMLHSSNKNQRFHEYFIKEFGAVPSIFSVHHEQDVCIKCHRMIWQWKVYKLVVEDAKEKLFQRLKRFNKTSSSWNELTEKWSPLDVYESLKLPVIDLVKLSERVIGSPINSDVFPAEQYLGLKHWEWNDIPKPVCVVHSYLNKLSDYGVLKKVGNDLYVVEMSSSNLSRFA